MPSRTIPATSAPLGDSLLFKPLPFGALNLEHRVMMAPLTRMRGVKESDGVWVPGDLNVEYYSQRATKGGFQLTEACPISRYACGYPVGVPGIFTQTQIAGWKRVTDAIHAKGGFIFCQLWHVGRATVPSFLDGKDCVSSSNIPIEGPAMDGTEYKSTPPKPMTIEEIHEVTEECAAAALRAREAGFDGVEIHSANGYLLDQFLHDNVNTRTDEYGGSIEKRSRFLLEVIKAVAAAVGSDRVGVRLSPYNYFQDTRDSNPNEHWAYVCKQIAGLPDTSRPTYIHMVEPRFDEVLDESAKIAALVGKKASKPSLTPFRNILQEAGIKFIAAGNYDADNCLPKLEAGETDAVIFGRHFIANPDLPRRLAEGLSLNKYDRTTFYGADPPQKGYTEYPFYTSA